MKTKFLFAMATLALFAALNTAAAVQPLHSPKGKAFAESLRRVPVVQSDVDLSKVRPVGNAKAVELVRSFQAVPSGGVGMDIAHGARPLLSPKDPRYESVLRELRTQEFQIAPLR